MPEPIFQPALFEFIRELVANNNREWFTENKKRYERDIKEAAFAFITEVGPGLREISPHIQAIPKAVGGSLFRIYRDVRFSSDKRPYKTHVGIHFRHEQAKNAYAPGFYLHLEPGQVFAATGIWHPENKVLRTLREAMVSDPAAWEDAKASIEGPFEFGGESLKRAPKGVSPDHPLIEDLRRKDLIVVANLEEEEAVEADFPERFLDLCRGASPLTAYICRALGVPF